MGSRNYRNLDWHYVGICASLQSVTRKCLRFYPSMVHVTMATVAGLTYNFMWVGTSRYLENSGCVGMCVNMCKIPTQDFFTNDFGLPLTMTPSKSYDFDSCVASCHTFAVISTGTYSKGLNEGLHVMTLRTKVSVVQILLT